MKVWLDDLRPMPLGFDTCVKTAPEAIKLLETKKVTLISFDHDLGDGAGTGYEVAVWIEGAAFLMQIPRLAWEVHTQNPVGAKNIRAAMEGAEKHWTKWEEITMRGGR